MKILQLCTKVPYPPKDGGAEGIYVFTKAFASLGHSVDILAVNPPKHYISESELDNLPSNVRIYPVYINTNVNLFKALRNLVFSGMPYHVERFFHHTYVQHLIEILKNNGPDIIQLEGIYLCPYIPLIRKLIHSKIILRAHNIENILWQNIAENETNFFKKVYLKFQARRLKQYEINQISLIDGVTTVTENDFFILNSYRDNLNVEVVPFGVEIDTQASAHTAVNQKELYFLGSLDWMPNQEAIQWFVDEAWPQIQKKIPSMVLHIAGRNAPKWLADYLHNQKGVVFHGEITDAKAFSDQFNIMVAPLFSGSGIRVKIIDAMLHGKVVIASSKAIDGIPAISGQHFLKADTIDEYVSQINLLLNSSDLISQISSNAKVLINEKFNILAIASKLIDFYNNVQNG
jgi:polysaccharide biosynthesis protein PslH